MPGMIIAGIEGAEGIEGIDGVDGVDAGAEGGVGAGAESEGGISGISMLGGGATLSARLGENTETDASAASTARLGTRFIAINGTSRLKGYKIHFRVDQSGNCCGSSTARIAPRFASWRRHGWTTTISSACARRSV